MAMDDACLVRCIRDSHLRICKASSKTTLNVTTTRTRKRISTSHDRFLTKQSRVVNRTRTDGGSGNEGTCSSVLTRVFLTLSHDSLGTCVSPVTIGTTAGVSSNANTKFTCWIASHCVCACACTCMRTCVYVCVTLCVVYV